MTLSSHQKTHSLLLLEGRMVYNSSTTKLGQEET